MALQEGVQPDGEGRAHYVRLEVVGRIAARPSRPKPTEWLSRMFRCRSSRLWGAMGTFLNSPKPVETLYSRTGLPSSFANFSA